MWTLKLILASLLVSSQGNILERNSGRINGGFNAAHHAPKCFTTVKAQFPESDVTKQCGGCLIGSNKVLTTGNCVTTSSDGVAKIIHFTIGSGNPKTRTSGYGVSKVSLAPGYDYKNRNSVNNLAVLTLNKTVKFNNKLAAAIPYFNATQDAFVDLSLFVCGYGDINNKEVRPSALQCTYLTAVPGTECNPEITTPAPGAPRKFAFKIKKKNISNLTDFKNLI